MSINSRLNPKQNVKRKHFQYSGQRQTRGRPEGGRGPSIPPKFVKKKWTKFFFKVSWRKFLISNYLIYKNARSCLCLCFCVFTNIKIRNSYVYIKYNISLIVRLRRVFSLLFWYHPLIPIRPREVVLFTKLRRLQIDLEKEQKKKSFRSSHPHQYFQKEHIYIYWYLQGH